MRVNYLFGERGMDGYLCYGNKQIPLFVLHREQSWSNDFELHRWLQTKQTLRILAGI